jgi:hypothetical protein
MSLDDLDAAERRWRQRSLFRKPKPRSRLPAILTVIALVGFLVAFLFPDFVPQTLRLVAEAGILEGFSSSRP